MTVYVDDMHKTHLGRFGRMKMSHMVADSHDELIQMAATIGVNIRWIQYEGTYKEHFDISMSMREKAVKAGAVEVTMSQLGRIMREKKERML